MGRARVGLGLQATTALAPDDALEVVRQAAEGANRPGPLAAGTRVVVAAVGVGTLRLGVVDDDWSDLLAMTAAATADDAATTRLTIAVDHARSLRRRRLGVIPHGPRLVPGRVAYERFLALVREALVRSDPGVTIRVAEP
jgi:hypothetical protein